MAAIVDPTQILCEVLGQPSAQMRSPVNAGYLCPHINSVCTKKGHFISGPYPVCSVWYGSARHGRRKIMCVCPRRFHEANLISDVIQRCWIGKKPKNPQVSYEVKMKGFGQVDFVISDIDEKKNTVRDFISVELQAMDLTGSVEPAYTALISSANLEGPPKYGPNWANVRKRYLSQLIAKGFFHHHWGTKIVAVLQSAVYDKFREFTPFDELTVAQGNIVFMLYDFEPAPQLGNGMLSLKLRRVVATSHSSLMNATLYRQTPPREQFCEKILQQMR